MAHGVPGGCQVGTSEDLPCRSSRSQIPPDAGQFDLRQREQLILLERVVDSSGDMSETRNRAREALKALIADACAQVVTSTEALAEYSGGTAIFNLERDQPLSDLPRFPAGYEALQHVPEFVRAFGTEHGERATLQFVYEYFTRTERFEFDIEAFDATFEAFLRELDKS